MLPVEGVLAVEGELTSEFLQQFDQSQLKQLAFSVGYLDTASLHLRQTGWGLRIRKRADQPEHRLQFKKRYPVQRLQETIALASSESFTSTADEWDVEVDWGIQHQTLSFAQTSRQNFDMPTQLAMPDLPAIKALLLQQAPVQFPVDIVQEYGLMVYGYVPFTRYRNLSLSFENKTIDGISVEVWQFPENETAQAHTLIELSFRAKGLADAQSQRDTMRQWLAEKKLLLSNDALKSRLTIERFSQ
ncbi:hypothetical protein [Alkalimonas amylolytica]|uniref:hypothetical protein n=1 Tax=Alkalimonas amylolytica TaxID=152573 RepID=UPI001114C72D|nr:hypothetical protein [Alkalimonas amylolytica]